MSLKITDEDNNELVGISFTGTVPPTPVDDNTVVVNEHIDYHQFHFTDVIGSIKVPKIKWLEHYTPQVHSVRNTLSNTHYENLDFLITGRYKNEFVYFLPTHTPKKSGATYKDLFPRLKNGMSVSVHHPHDLSTDLIDTTVAMNRCVLLKIRNTNTTFHNFFIRYLGTFDSPPSTFVIEQQPAVVNAFGISIPSAKNVCLVANVQKGDRDVVQYLSGVDVRVARDVKTLGLYIPKYGINTLGVMKPKQPIEITQNVDTNSTSTFTVTSNVNDFVVANSVTHSSLEKNYPVKTHIDYFQNFIIKKLRDSVFSGRNNLIYNSKFAALEQLYQSYIVFPANIMTNIPKRCQYISAELLGAYSFTGQNRTIDFNNMRGKEPVCYGFGWSIRSRAAIDSGKNDAFVIQFYNIGQLKPKLPNSIPPTMPVMAFIKLKLAFDNKKNSENVLTKFAENTRDDYEGDQVNVYPITSLANTTFPRVKNSRYSHNGRPLKFVGDADNVGSFATGFSGSTEFDGQGALLTTETNKQYVYVVSECNWDVRN